MSLGSLHPSPGPADLDSTVPLLDEKFDWLSSQFKPWNPTSKPPTDEEVTRIVVLSFEQMTTGPQGGGFRWFVNNRLNNGTKPDVPYLVQLYGTPPEERLFNYSRALENHGYDEGSDSYPALSGEVLDIVILDNTGQTSGQAEAHPWHSHGNKVRQFPLDVYLYASCPHGPTRGFDPKAHARWTTATDSSTGTWVLGRETSRIAR